jgi:acyl-homoserine lactone acylase PvdQ
LSFCKTVCWLTPRAWAAPFSGSQPSGASAAARRRRSSSVTRTRHGAPEVRWEPFNMPTSTQRITVLRSTPGSSGWPKSPHYSDQFELWKQVKLAPMISNWEEIKKTATGMLTLK